MFDTLKLKINDQRIIEKDKMIRTETFHPESNEPIVRWLHPRSKFGAYVSHKEGDDFFVLELSAKILREKYLKGIRPETIDQMTEQIGRSVPCIRHRLPSDLVLESGVFRADHTLNVKTDKIQPMLRMLRDSANWGRKMVDRRFGDSAIFYNTRETMLIYDKPAEVFRYWSDFEGLGLNKESYRNILRIEYRPKKIDVMRANTETKDSFTELSFPTLGLLIDKFKETLKTKIDSFSFSEIGEINSYSDFLFNGDKIDTNLKILGLYTYFKSINFDEKVLESEIERIKSKSQRSKIRSKLKKYTKISESSVDYKGLREEFILSIQRILENEY